MQLANYGEDEHDLRLRRIGGTRTYRIGTVAPGRVGELEARFLPGRFRLWCSLADHRVRGMSAVLFVRKVATTPLRATADVVQGFVAVEARSP